MDFLLVFFQHKKVNRFWIFFYTKNKPLTNSLKFKSSSLEIGTKTNEKKKKFSLIKNWMFILNFTVTHYRPQEKMERDRDSVLSLCTKSSCPTRSHV